MTPTAIFIATAIGFVLIFLCLMVSIHCIMKGADNRLSRANDMVLELSHSVRELSSSISGIERMMEHLEKEYSSHIDQVCHNRDEIMDAYKKLLARYEEMQHDSFYTLKELARRPTVTTNNNNNTEP